MKSAFKKTSPQAKPLKILNLNCQSVKAKLAQFLALLDEEDLDIVLGTEFWLNEDITNGEIFPEPTKFFGRIDPMDIEVGHLSLLKIFLLPLKRLIILQIVNSFGYVSRLKVLNHF